MTIHCIHATLNAVEPAGSLERSSMTALKKLTAGERRWLNHANAHSDGIMGTANNHELASLKRKGYLVFGNEIVRGRRLWKITAKGAEVLARG